MGRAAHGRGRRGGRADGRPTVESRSASVEGSTFATDVVMGEVLGELPGREAEMSWRGPPDHEP
jgi:hypothetical protein